MQKLKSIKRENSKKEKLKAHSGITLIALIITIIVLLILAGVALATLTGDSGILNNAESAKNQTNYANSKEQVELAIQGALTEGLGTVTKANLVAELDKLLGAGEENYTIIPDDETGPWTVTVTKTGYSTTISETGSIQKVIKVTEIAIKDLELEEGQSSQLEVTKTPSNCNEGLTYTSNNTAIATVDETGKVTAVAEGTATITVAGKISTEVKGKSTITVTKPVVPAIGDYVTYNVAYTDMYTSYNFTASNGWRILDGGKSNGDGTYSNVKLISTGIPARLYYHFNTNAGSATNGWWGTDDQVKELYGETYSTGYSNYRGRYAAAGLLKNFESIPFMAGTSAAENKGCFTKINSTDSETVYGSIFKAEGASGVHNLTLEELNTARGLESDSGIKTTEKDGDTGLFYLKNLATENADFGYTIITPCTYWLASPVGASAFPDELFEAGSDGIIYIQHGDSRAEGVRPVVSLSSKIKKNASGNWEIVP